MCGNHSHCGVVEASAISEGPVVEVPAIGEVPAVEEAPATGKDEKPKDGEKPEPVPRVGVSALIQNRDGKFLVSKRMGSHGAGSWQFPGGHLEFGEDLLRCAERETEEETGLDITGLGVVTITNDFFKAEKKEEEKKEGEDKHYITIFAKCIMNNLDDEPELKEPHKCQGWHWKSWEEIKAIGEAAASDPSSAETLFLPIINLIKQEPDINKLYESRGL
ncbi:NUDIX hydrolase domain-like protein [Trichoderma chlorosporum]